MYLFLGVSFGARELLVLLALEPRLECLNLGSESAVAGGWLAASLMSWACGAGGLAPPNVFTAGDCSGGRWLPAALLPFGTGRVGLSGISAVAWPADGLAVEGVACGTGAEALPSVTPLLTANPCSSEA